jgi:hypothetical protein
MDRSFIGSFRNFRSHAASHGLRPFQTDYCTNFPNGTPENKELWKERCIQHDLYLWAGGTKYERLATDRQLKNCVISKGAPVPPLMLGSAQPLK